MTSAKQSNARRIEVETYSCSLQPPHKRCGHVSTAAVYGGKNCLKPPEIDIENTSIRYDTKGLQGAVLVISRRQNVEDVAQLHVYCMLRGFADRIYAPPEY